MQIYNILICFIINANCELFSENHQLNSLINNLDIELNVDETLLERWVRDVDSEGSGDSVDPEINLEGSNRANVPTRVPTTDTSPVTQTAILTSDPVTDHPENVDIASTIVSSEVEDKTPILEDKTETEAAGTLPPLVSSNVADDDSNSTDVITSTTAIPSNITDEPEP